MNIYIIHVFLQNVLLSADIFYIYIMSFDSFKVHFCNFYSQPTRNCDSGHAAVCFIIVHSTFEQDQLKIISYPWRGMARTI